MSPDDGRTRFVMTLPGVEDEGTGVLRLSGCPQPRPGPPR
jgi:hypothetical protein